MSSARHNIYTLIHKGIRRQLCQCLGTLGGTDPGDRGALQQALQELEVTLTVCREHLEHENTFIHPALMGCNSGAPLQTAGEHEEHRQAIAELRELASRVPALHADSRAAALYELYQSFALFVAENLHHMQVEETLNSQLLWENFTDDQILAIEYQLVSSLTPFQSEQSLQLILGAGNHSERSGMLEALNVGMPADEMRRLMAYLQQTLAATEWDKLSRLHAA